MLLEVPVKGSGDDLRADAQRRHHRAGAPWLHPADSISEKRLGSRIRETFAPPRAVGYDDRQMDSQEVDVEVLVQTVLSGRKGEVGWEAAWERLFRWCQRRLAKCLRSRFRELREQSELDTFIEDFIGVLFQKKLPRYTVGSGTFGAWLGQVAVRHYSDTILRRRKTRLGSAVSLDELRDPGGGASDD
jgi:hypothetical protein